MKKTVFVILAISPVLFFNSCTKDLGKNPALVSSVNTNTVICDSIKYSTAIQAIINNSCATPGCHVPGGTGTGDFTSYAGVFAKVSSGSFKARVIDGTPGFMPASGRLPDVDIQKIQCWLNAGAPNN